MFQNSAINYHMLIFDDKSTMTKSSLPVTCALIASEQHKTVSVNTVSSSCDEFNENNKQTTLTFYWVFQV